MSNIPRKPRKAKQSRICLRCNKPFASTGPGNRICEPCSRRPPRSPDVIENLNHRKNSTKGHD